MIECLDRLFPFTRGCYFFAIALVLAFLEIQIEGKHGWAEKLPVWRWDSARIRRLLGRPITGYHVYFNLMLLLFIHLPLLYTGFTPALEAELIAFYFFLTVFWDFQWFVWNPEYRLRRFRRGEIWWYPTWFLGLPTAYYLGIAASCAAYLAAGPSWLRLREWGGLFGLFVALTLLSLPLARLALRKGKGRTCL